MEDAHGQGEEGAAIQSAMCQSDTLYRATVSLAVSEACAASPPAQSPLPSAAAVEFVLVLTPGVCCAAQKYNDKAEKDKARYASEIKKCGPLRPVLMHRLCQTKGRAPPAFVFAPSGRRRVLAHAATLISWQRCWAPVSVHKGNLRQLTTLPLGVKSSVQQILIPTCCPASYRRYTPSAEFAKPEKKKAAPKKKKAVVEEPDEDDEVREALPQNETFKIRHMLRNTVLC